MAKACSFHEDQFLCSICLDVFTEPVSIPCGHNFCKACLTRHWESKEQWECPLCKEKFSKELRLCVNTGFREVVENFKEHQATAAKDSPVRPGQVPCDVCLGNVFRACKTCLVCLTSYCETHLEPHLRVEALKRHKLTNPVHNLEDQICKKHNRMLELFCRDDQACVCVLCTDHSDHDTVRLEEACVDKKAQVRNKKVEVQEIKQKCGKRAQKIKGMRQNKRRGRAMADSVVSNQMQAPLVWNVPLNQTLSWWIPDKFSVCGFLHGNMDPSVGRFYKEVQALEGTSLDPREVMQGSKTFIPNPGNGDWVVRLGAAPNKALCNFPVQLFSMVKHENVVVFVDEGAGLVTFWEVDTGNTYSFPGCKFNEMVYLFYSRCPEDSWTRRLQRKVQELKAWSQHPDSEFFFRCILFVFLFVVCICVGISENLKHEKN